MKLSTEELYNALLNITKVQFPTADKQKLRLCAFGKLCGMLEGKSRLFQVRTIQDCLALSNTSDEKAFLLERLIKTNPTYKQMKSDYYNFLLQSPEVTIGDYSVYQEMQKQNNYNLCGSFIENFVVDHPFNGEKINTSAFIAGSNYKIKRSLTRSDCDNYDYNKILSLLKNESTSLKSITNLMVDQVYSATQNEVCFALFGQLTDKLISDYQAVQGIKNNAYTPVRSYQNFDEYFTNIVAKDALTKILKTYEVESKRLPEEE